MKMITLSLFLKKTLLYPKYISIFIYLSIYLSIYIKNEFIKSIKVMENKFGETE